MFGTLSFVVVAIVAALYGAIYALAAIMALELQVVFLALAALLVWIGLRIRTRRGLQAAALASFAIGFGLEWWWIDVDLRSRCQPPSCGVALSPLETAVWGLVFLLAPIALVLLMTYQQPRVARTAHRAR